jgi:prophage DNA circulation protein
MRHPTTRRGATAAITLITLLFAGCATTRNAYYNAWEKYGGYAKRERLVDNVKAARAEQVQAKKEFATALDQFKSVVNFQGGDLEATYNKLNKEYERCDSQAGEVRDKIQAVKNVSQAMFDEWAGDIKQMSDPSLKQSSQDLMDKTKQNYKEMITRMDAAAASMDPVLRNFHDRVLFLKANLNAMAFASLKGTEAQLGGDIDKLIKEMDASIKEADQFIAQMQPGK